jgi:hypothetical protein
MSALPIVAQQILITARQPLCSRPDVHFGTCKRIWWLPKLNEISHMIYMQRRCPVGAELYSLKVRETLQFSADSHMLSSVSILQLLGVQHRADTIVGDSVLCGVSR